MNDIGQQGPGPGDSSLGRQTSAATGWMTRGGIAKALIAASIALGGGLGTFAIAHAATASPAATPAPSTSPKATTHNCPNM